MTRFHECVPLLSADATSDFVHNATRVAQDFWAEADHWVEAWHTWVAEGWAVLHAGAVEDPLLDDVANFVVSHLPVGLLPGRPEDGYGRIQDAFRERHHVPGADAVKRLAEHPAITAFIWALTGRQAKPFQTLNFRYGTQQAAHSDVMHFGSFPQGLLVAAWTALEDVDPSAGPLFFYPGLHKPRVFYLEDLGIDAADPEAYVRYEKALRTKVLEEHDPPRLALLKKGEVLLWAGNLPHGGAAIENPRRTRLSQVTHYYLEGVTAYWIPRMSLIQEGRIVPRPGPRPQL